jgi:murein DD-endopeptidase MepM/ murein hydrolase activator NlpD
VGSGKAGLFRITPRREYAVNFKKITIVLVPEGTSRVKQVRLPRFLVVLFVLLSLSAGGCVLWLAQDYYAIKAGLPELAHLKKENEYQKRQFIHLAQRIDEITQKMGEMKEFDRKLKDMVDLETGKGTPALGGVGGSEPSLLRPDYSMVKSHKDLVRLMHRSLDNVDNEIALGERDKAELHKFLENQKTLLASTPSIWPTKGWLSSRFGYRTSPFTGEREFHRGIDVATRMNAPIIAPADGVVTYVGRDRGYGRVISIKHGKGLITRYAHLHKALVKKGDYVKRGEAIALVGNSGRSTGPHLHYEVHLNGMAVNPLRYITD